MKFFVSFRRFKLEIAITFGLLIILLFKFDSSLKIIFILTLYLKLVKLITSILIIVMHYIHLIALHHLYKLKNLKITISFPTRVTQAWHLRKYIFIINLKKLVLKFEKN